MFISARLQKFVIQAFIQGILFEIEIRVEPQLQVAIVPSHQI